MALNAEQKKYMMGQNSKLETNNGFERQNEDATLNAKPKRNKGSKRLS